MCSQIPEETSSTTPAIDLARFAPGYRYEAGVVIPAVPQNARGPSNCLAALGVAKAGGFQRQRVRDRHRGPCRRRAAEKAGLL
jgi:hypothetical protein